MGGKIPSERCSFFEEWLAGSSEANSRLWVAARPPLGFTRFKCWWCTAFQILCVTDFFCLLGTGLGSWVTGSVFAKRQWQNSWLFPQYNCSWLLNSRALRQDACCRVLEVIWANQKLGFDILLMCSIHNFKPFLAVVVASLGVSITCTPQAV